MVHNTMQTATFYESQPYFREKGLWQTIFVSGDPVQKVYGNKLRVAWKQRVKDLRRITGDKRQFNTEMTRAFISHYPELASIPPTSSEVDSLNGKIQQFFSSGSGAMEDIAPKLVEFLGAGQAFLKSVDVKDLSGWALDPESVTIAETSSQASTFTEVLILSGGSSGVWRVTDEAMKQPSDTIGQQERIYIEICDASLMPSVEPGEVVVFKRISYARVKRSLLIRSKDEPDSYAIRVFAPKALDGEDAFIDPRDSIKYPPLLAEKWEVVGMALGKLSDEGTQL